MLLRSENGERGENHYSIIDCEGEVSSDYVKMHPFSMAGEDQFFVKGENMVSCDVCGVRIGTFICYDLRFPVIFQKVDDDTSVVIVAANWPKVRREHWSCLLKARAIENQVYVLGINCVGMVGGVEYSGDSCVIDPHGTVLVSSQEKEELLCYEINADLKQFRENFNCRVDRRRSEERRVGKEC